MFPIKYFIIFNMFIDHVKPSWRHFEQKSLRFTRPYIILLIGNISLCILFVNWYLVQSWTKSGPEMRWCASTILEYVFRTLNIFWRYILTWAGRKYSHSYYNNGIHPIIIFILTHLLTSFRRDDHNLWTITYEMKY